MIPALTPAEIERFHSKIDTSGPCHLWTNEKNNQGYGRFSISRDGKRVRILAHRLALLLATGRDPAGSVVRHGCDNPPCVNPDHLRLGTQADNSRDSITRGRARTEGLDLGHAKQAHRLQLKLARQEKRCPSCGTVKPFAEFHLARNQPDGRQGHCKACRSERLRDAWRNDPEFREKELARKRRSREQGGLNGDQRAGERRRRMRRAA